MSTTQTPKVFQYVQIADQIRRQIAKGILQPGDRLPSRREMRERYGINFNTLEKAHALLEAENLIIRSNRSGVYVAEPNHKTATGFIGICGVSFTQSDFSAYWTRLMDGVETAAREGDAQIVFLSSDSPTGWDMVDGLLLNSMDARIPAKYVPEGLPIVAFFAKALITGTGAERARVEKNLSTVKTDDYAGMQAATRHLLALGHSKIAYLHNDHSHTEMQSNRSNGYIDALNEAGISPAPQWRRLLPQSASRVHFMSAGREGMRSWLNEDWDELGCTALLAHNDDVAWGAIDVLRSAGIDVPGQVSVVGFDGTETADCCDPPLTTVEVPLRRMGRTGVELLREQFKGQAEKTELVLPTNLHVRASTGPCT